ncbi:peptidylprolyl isomerase [Paenibacillus sp. M1]|uniref:peptidylprolyl isomerase n=1 Tax=Paenibacillus haidiansis TaxID=1574488 RepID=A0ABU7VWV5_9BACL
MEDKDNKDLQEIKGPQDQPDTSEDKADGGQASFEDTDAVLDDQTAEDKNQDIASVSSLDPDHRDSAEEGASRKPGAKLVWPIVSLVLAVLLVAALINPPFAAKKAEAVASVNGIEITKDQLYNELVTYGSGEAALDTLITKELIRQEAQKANVEVTEADVDKEIQGYIESFGSEDNLNQALVANGMTLAQLRENIQMNALLTKLLEPQVTVTDDQIKQTFEDNKESFNTPEQVRTSIILVATEAEAQEVIKELKAGKDFAELAKSKSLDEATKANGGDTDFFARGEMEEAVEEAAFKLAKDEISEPVKTSAGYEVIKLTDRKEAHTATLEEKKDEIREGLVAQQVSQLSGTWMEDIKSKANITNKLTDTADDADAAAGAAADTGAAADAESGANTAE